MVASYNFAEIRKELQQRGHQFRSQCDTEVLIAGYQEWGIDAFCYLEIARHVRLRHLGRASRQET